MGIALLATFSLDCLSKLHIFDMYFLLFASINLAYFLCCVEMLSSALLTENILFDHRPLQLNDDDYQRVCQIPKIKVL